MSNEKMLLHLVSGSLTPPLKKEKKQKKKGQNNTNQFYILRTLLCVH